jgi:alanine dehydrogenase
VYSSSDHIERAVTYSDLIIGAVLIPGASAPMLVTKPMLKTMKPGTVMVDIAIDQGGCFETSHATKHSDPVYVVDGVTHYCVANMPGAVPLTSALALNNAVLPYALALADKGWKKALLEDANLRRGLNVCKGKITHKGVAESLKLEYVETPKELAA